MTTLVEASTRIRVDAPDARTAFALERRLAHLHPTSIGYGLDWRVELPDAGDHLGEIEAAVQHWLGESGIRSTQIHLDGDVRTITSPPGVEEPLGTGYDSDGVLQHEP